jgi:Zn-dependent protease with chaperone function
MPTAEARPRPLLWLYGLIAVSLVSVGVAVGNLFFVFTGPLSLFVPYVVRAERCEARYGRDRPSLTVDELNACMGDQTRIRGFVLLGAVLLLVAGTLVLAVAVPWRDLRRLRRFGRLDHPAARDRFADLCRRLGVSGRRAPRLWVAGPGANHAFTVALPGGRRTIVIPARVALGPGGEFDAVASHEIAHVLARDVTWVSVLRGPLWLLVPVAVVAGLPLFDRDGVSSASLAMLVEIVLLVTTVTVLARALLRLREHDADRFAARAGAEADLVELFDRAPTVDGPSSHGRVWSRARRLLARHPARADRVLALQGVDHPFEGGFAQALAAGFVAMMAMGTVTTLADTFDRRWYSWGGTAIASATGAAVIATIFPSLFRRAREPGNRPQWWRAVAGAVTGIVLGAVVSPVVTATGQLRFPLVWPGRPDLTVLAEALLALSVGGVVALAIGLAQLAVGAERAVVRRIGPVSAGLVAFVGIWPVGPVAAVLDSPNDLRYWLAYGLARNPGHVLAAALLPAAYLLLLVLPRTRVPDAPRRGRLGWLVAGTATVLAATVAILASGATADLNDQLRGQQQRWWICAAAGVVVLVVVALASPGPYAWAQAVLAATATTAVASAAHYLYAQVTHRPAEPEASAWNLGVASVWLLYATVLLAPVLMPLSGRRRSPTSGAVATRYALVGTAVATSAAVLAVLVIGVPGGVAMNARQRWIASLAAQYAAARHPLTDEQAERVAESAVLVLPMTWAGVESGPAGGGIVSRAVSVTDPACLPLVRESFLVSGEPHRRATGKTKFTSSRTGALRATDLTVTVYSYDLPIVETILLAARDARRACSAFSLVNGAASLDFLVEPATPPGLGEISWRYNSSMSATVGADRVTGANAYVMVAAGNTIIVVYLTAVLEPLDEHLLDTVLTNALYTLLHLP